MYNQCVLSPAGVLSITRAFLRSETGNIECLKEWFLFATTVDMVPRHGLYERQNN